MLGSSLSVWGVVIMTSDSNKPVPSRGWKRPFIWIASPLALALLAWISTGTDVFQTLSKPSPPAVQQSGSHDQIVVNHPAVAARPAEVSSAPPTASGPSVRPQLSGPRPPIVTARPVPQEQPPAFSSAARDSRPLTPAVQAPEPQSEWFDEAEGAVVDRRPTMVHRLAATSAFQRMCVPRISAHYGVAGGIVSNALTRPGNPNCVQATYGDIMSLTIEPCGGELTEISQIEVERGAFLEDGRPRTYAASLSYSLIANGQETLPLPLGTGGYRRVQSVQFSPIRASAVRVTVRSPRTTGYRIYQRICSVVVR